MARRYVVLMGPPGAGKGTQASRLAARYGLCRIATGDLLRAAQAAGTELGREAGARMKAGELVPDDVILEIVAEELDRPGCAGGAVFDGFPRTVAQAEGLERLLAERGEALERVLAIEVPEEEIVRRLSGRRVCETCGKLYNISFGSLTSDRCEACGGALVQRADDRPETIRRRLAVYREETEPVLAWYAGPGRPDVIPVRGDQPIEAVESTIRQHLDAVESER